MEFSPRFIHAGCKKYDGMEYGSAGIWSMRVSKLLGVLPEKDEHNHTISDNPNFDYSLQQLVLARKFRINYYERIRSPEAIKIALKHGPVILEFDFFDSIHSDVDGVLTLPDEENTKSDCAHSVMVYGYDKEANSFNFINSWGIEWGNRGHGKISLEYLSKYFVTAFVSSPSFYTSRLLKRKKVKIVNKNWYVHISVFTSLTGDQRRIYIFETKDMGGNLAAWSFYAVNTEGVGEVLELFVAEQYRRQSLGSFLLFQMKYFCRTRKTIGFISSHDLINDRDEIITSFLLKNNFYPIVDRSAFKDSRLRIEII